MLAAIALAACLGIAAVPALGQELPPNAPPREVNGPEISMLIRTTLVALHQANVTGNYTVLHALGSSDLQAANNPARLTDLFRDFRETRLNLAPTVLYDPMLDENPMLTTNGVLRLIGHFPTEPQEILFDLTFRYESGAWRISAISVGTRPAGEASSSSADQLVAEQAPPTVPSPRLRPAASAQN